MKITYNVQALPERTTRRDSEETIALKVFLADGDKKNMVFEYDTPGEAKKRYDSLRNYRSANKLQAVFEMWRNENLVCIVKVKKTAGQKGAAK